MGKTTTAYLVAKEMGFDVMELNASDTRSKKQLDAIVTDAVSSQSLSKVSTKRVNLLKLCTIKIDQPQPLLLYLCLFELKR